MSAPNKLLCEEWVATLEYWVHEAVSSLESTGNSTWATNHEALQRLKPFLKAAKTEDIAAFLGDFGAGLLHSLLVSFDQGPIYVRGPSLKLSMRNPAPH